MLCVRACVWECVCVWWYLIVCAFCVCVWVWNDDAIPDTLRMKWHSLLWSELILRLSTYFWAPWGTATTKKKNLGILKCCQDKRDSQQTGVAYNSWGNKKQSTAERERRFGFCHIYETHIRLGNASSLTINKQTDISFVSGSDNHKFLHSGIMGRKSQ